MKTLKARLKGSDEMQEFVMSFDETGDFKGLALVTTVGENETTYLTIPRDLVVFPEDDKEDNSPNKVDWEQARINAAIAVLQAHIIGCCTGLGGYGMSPEANYMREAIAFADALVNELQK